MTTQLYSLPDPACSHDNTLYSLPDPACSDDNTITPSHYSVSDNYNTNCILDLMTPTDGVDTCVKQVF